MALEAQCKPDNSVLCLERIYIILVLLTIKSRKVKMKNMFFKKF